MLLIGLLVWIILIIWIAVATTPGIITAFLLSLLASTAAYVALRLLVIWIISLFRRK